MTRLVARIVGLGLFLLLTYVALWVVPLHADLVYSSLLDKHKLLQITPSPRLIFVGGSGIALGLDSKLIEEQLGLPVINMGVNAGFGLHYMLEEVVPYLRTGDIVLVVPEYEHFYGTLLEGDQNLLWALRIRPSTIREITWRQLLQLVPEIPTFMQQRFQEIIRRRTDPIYNRDAFNEQGDFVNHLDLPKQSIPLYAIDNGLGLNGEALQTLAEFTTVATARGVIVRLIYPAIADSFWHYQQNAAKIEELHSSIQRDQIIPEVSTPHDFFLPDELFFDTVYHLLRSGRQLRSERIAALLQKDVQISEEVQKFKCSKNYAHCSEAVSQQ